MLRERMDNFAHGVCENVEPELVYAEIVGRYKEVQDLLEMTFEELKGE